MKVNLSMVTVVSRIHVQAGYDVVVSRAADAAMQLSRRPLIGGACSEAVVGRQSIHTINIHRVQRRTIRHNSKIHLMRQIWVCTAACVR